MRAIPIALLLVGASVLLAGCGERDEPTGQLSAPYPARVPDADGRDVAVARAPARVVSLSEAATAIAAELGIGRLLVGAAGARPAGTPGLEGGDGSVDVRRVVELEPDLVLASRAVATPLLEEVARRTGATIYRLPASEPADLVRSTLWLGDVLGLPAEARRAATEFRSRLASLDARLAGREPVRVFADTGLSTPPAAGSVLAGLVQRAGGLLVAAGGGGVPVEPAAIVAADPEVYLATDESRVTLASLERHPALSRITAVRDRRVLVLAAATLAEIRPASLETLEEIATLLHPDAFR